MEYQILKYPDAKPFRARPYYEVSEKVHSKINDTLVAEIISERDDSQCVSSSNGQKVECWVAILRWHEKIKRHDSLYHELPLTVDVAE